MSAAGRVLRDLVPGRDAYLVARREFVLRVRGKTFRLGTLVIVLLLAGYVVLHGRVLNKTSVTSVGVTGPAQVLAQPLAAVAPKLGLHLTIHQIGDLAQGENQVRSGQLNVLVSGPATSPRVLVKGQLNATLHAALTGVVQQEVLAAQLTAHGVNPRPVEGAVAGATVTVQSLSETTSRSTQQQAVGIIVAAVLYTALMIYGNLVAQGVIEEKANRIVEILLATIRPSQLLIGKVIGIGLVGLLQLAIIGAAGLLLIARSHAITLPGFGAGVIAAALLWFILGFFLYAILFATAGSLVSRQEDAQQATLPISMALVVAYLGGFAVVLRNPGSLTSAVLSLVPLLAPVLMPARLALGAAPVWQFALAIVLTVAAIGAAIWLAARVYAVSVVRTGARIPLTKALRGE